MGRDEECAVMAQTPRRDVPGAIRTAAIEAKRAKARAEKARQATEEARAQEQIFLRDYFEKRKEYDDLLQRWDPETNEIEGMPF